MRLKEAYNSFKLFQTVLFQFLAFRTNGCAYAIMLRPSVVVCDVNCG